MRQIALQFGINNYKHGPLNGCLNDIKDLGAVLSTDGFKCKAFLDRDQVTKATIDEEIGDLMGGSKDEDSIIIQYSGHGSYIPDLDGDEPDGTDEVWVPGDYETAGMFTDDRLNEILSLKHPGAHVLVLSDSCFSGTVTRLASLPGEEDRRIRFLPPEVFLSSIELRSIGEIRRNFRQTFLTKFMQYTKALTTKAPAALFSGCQDTETSADCYFHGRPNGAFTYFLLQALRRLTIGKNTYGDLYKALRELLPSPNYQQTPNFIGTREQWNRPIFR